MKYINPTLEIIELETSDVILASNNKGSITVGDTTIEGDKGDFSTDFGELGGSF